MKQTHFGFHWKYNVSANGVPVPAMGRVYYVVDDFGNMQLVHPRSLTHSLS